MSTEPGAIRWLPQPRVTYEVPADVVVVGAGAAGLSAALAASGRGRRVLLVTKDTPGIPGAGDGADAMSGPSGSTPLAQGGLAAAVGAGDSPELHGQDTIAAGAGLCEPAAVAALVASAPAQISALTQLGARLDTRALHREGGHAASRIVTAGGDAIGAEVYRVLWAAVAASPVEVLSRTVALDVLTSWGAVTALLVGTADAGGGELRQGLLATQAVVIATGGFGQAFATTTNPAAVTGDGLALAARAGAELQDLEFVQFHPTVLWRPEPSGRRPLITEALRGAGAVLVDHAGRPVMAGRHPLGDLAPRDVVSAAMAQRMEQGGGPGDHLWLDATVVGREVLEHDFPTVTATCRSLGIDPAAEPVPVAPGAHYACGGIRAGMDGRTSVPGLYAVGEAASTGLHGANRLASNSLTEALAAGRAVGELLGQPGLPQPGPLLARRSPGLQRGAAGARQAAGQGGVGVSPAARRGLAAAMSRQAGVLRDARGLDRLLAQLGQAGPAAAAGLDLATVEATSLHTVSVLVTMSALARAESRGAHRWRDVPAVSGGPASHSMAWVEDGEVHVSAMAGGLARPAEVVSAGADGGAA